MKRKVVFGIFILLLCINSSRAQQQLSIDSLFNAIEHSKTFEEKYDAANLTLEQLNNFNRQQYLLDSLNFILSQLLQTAHDVNHTRLAEVLSMKAYVFYIGAKSDSSLYYYNEALKVFTSLKDQEGIAHSYNGLFFAYLNLNHFNTAVSYLFRSVEINTQLRDTASLMNAYWQLGRIYHDREKEPQKSIEYFNKCLALDTFVNATAYSYIAEDYLQLQEPDSAFYYLTKAKPALKSPKPFHPIYYFRALAKYYHYTGQLDSASFYFLKAIDGLEQVHQEHNSVKCFYHLGQIAHKKNDFTLAENYYLTAESYAMKHNRYFELPEIYFGLSELYQKNRQPEKAYSMFMNYKLVADSLKKSEETDILISTDMQYQFSVKEAQMKEDKLKKEFEMQAMVKQKAQTRIFTISGIAAILLFGGYGFYDFRKRKKSESRQALSNERLRISRELHDDIGSTLGSIAVYSDVAKNRSVKNENPVEVLSKIGTASRELIEKMSDIVWSLNPDNETFEQLQNRMQGFAAMILTPRNIVIDFKTDDTLKNIQLTSEQRRNIFLIYKEAVHNIVKYAECKNVLISFLNSNNSLSLLIKDDGKGFENPPLRGGQGGAYNGNGIKNMKARAGDMNASLNIISKINEGTNIELSLQV